MGCAENSRLKGLSPHLSSNRDTSKRRVLAIASALEESKGLVDLDLTHNFMMSDEAWDGVCDSLKAHPTLQVLHLQSRHTFERALLSSPAVLESRTQALLEMMKVNMSIHMIHLIPCYGQHEIYRRSVIQDEPAPAARSCHPKDTELVSLHDRRERRVNTRMLRETSTHPGELWFIKCLLMGI
jgi:hypothetical protein